MKGIISARVSTPEQIEDDRFSIPAQMKTMREYCEDKKIEIQSEYEVDESSTKEKREQFDNMIKEIKRSKEKIALIVETVDRLQRTFREMPTLDELRKSGKIEIHFMRENLVIHKDSSSADLIRWNVAVLAANFYVLQVSDNVKRSAKQRFHEGFLMGCPPVGYMCKDKDDENNNAEQMNKKSKKKKTKTNKKDNIILDPERAPMIKRMFEDYAYNGLSLLEIAKKYADEGFRTPISGAPIYKSYVSNILKNPFYAGTQQSKYGKQKHVYETITSEETYNQCQHIMQSYNKKGVTKYDNTKPCLYRGLIKCGCCEGTMTPDFKKGKYIYFFCYQASIGKCSNKAFTKIEDITNSVNSSITSLSINKVVYDDAIKHIKGKDDAHKRQTENKAKKLKQDIETKQATIDSLIDKLATCNSGISEDIQNRITKLKAEKAEIGTRLNEITLDEDNFSLTAEKLLELSRNADIVFDECSKLEEKNEFLEILASNFTLNQKNVCIFYKKPFDFFEKTAGSLTALPDLDSNQETSAPEADVLPITPSGNLGAQTHG